MDTASMFPPPGRRSSSPSLLAPVSKIEVEPEQVAPDGRSGPSARNPDGDWDSACSDPAAASGCLRRAPILTLARTVT
jgi:hypothetical protein